MIDSNSRILVQGKGYVKVSTVADSQQEVWDGEDFAVVTVGKGVQKEVLKIGCYDGHNVCCDKDLFILAKKRKDKKLLWHRASNLQKTHLLALTNQLPRFDFFPKEDFKFLGKINSYLLGVFLGACYNASIVSPTQLIIFMEENDHELRHHVNQALSQMDVPTTTELKYGNNHNKLRIIIRDEEFIKELGCLDIQKGFSEEIWKSKYLLEGLLKIIFTYSKISREGFELKLPNQALTNDIQQALALFGVPSTATKGLIRFRLMVGKSDFHKLCLRVGVLHAEKIANVITYERLRKVKKRWVSKTQVKETVLTNTHHTLYDVRDSKFMVNGLIAIAEENI